MDKDYDETVPFADFSSEEEEDPTQPNMKGVLMSASGVPMHKPKGEELKNAIDVLNRRLNKVEVQARKKRKMYEKGKGICPNEYRDMILAKAKATHHFAETLVEKHKN